MTASVRAAPPVDEWMRQPLRQTWLADPLVLDSSFQMMVLWTHEQRGAYSLPVHLGRYRQYRRSFPADGVRVVVTIGRAGDAQASADIDYLDHAGKLVARCEGYLCVLDPAPARGRSGATCWCRRDGPAMPNSSPSPSSAWAASSPTPRPPPRCGSTSSPRATPRASRRRGRWVLPPEVVHAPGEVRPDRVPSVPRLLRRVDRPRPRRAWTSTPISVAPTRPGVPARPRRGRAGVALGGHGAARPGPRRRHPRRHRAADRRHLGADAEGAGPDARREAGPARPVADEPWPHPLNRHATGLPATLLAKALGLGGTAFTLDAACASSLYAIKLAVRRVAVGPGRRHARGRAVAAGQPVHADGLRAAPRGVALGALLAVRRAGRRPHRRRGGGRLRAEAPRRRACATATASSASSAASACPTTSAAACSRRPTRASCGPCAPPTHRRAGGPTRSA